jgi:hypothetical protein
LFEASLNKYRGSFGQELADQLCGSAKEGKIDKRCFVYPITCSVFPSIVDGDGVLANRQFRIGRMPDFDVPD